MNETKIRMDGIEFDDLIELDHKKEIIIKYKNFPKTKFRKYDLPDDFYSSVHQAFKDGFDRYILNQKDRYFIVRFNNNNSWFL